MVQWAGGTRSGMVLAAAMCALAVPATAQAGDFSVDADGAVAAFAVTADGADTLRVRESTACGVGVTPCLSIAGVSGTTVTYQESDAAPGDQCAQDGPETVYCIAAAVAGDLGAQNDTIFGDGPIRFLVSGGGGDDSLGASDTHTLDDVLAGGPGADLLTGEDGDDELDGGDGNDKVNPSPGNDTITGGAGDDLLYGDTGNDTIGGGPGQDRLYGGAGDDQLDGGDGDDVFERSPGDVSPTVEGADVYRGGNGFDSLSFEGTTGNRTITLGDGANDGTSGEGDDVGGDVESVRGGFGNDTLTGDGSGNVLLGDYGDDTIRGGGGNDIVDGGSDTDQVFGEDGDDTVRGGSGADSIDGGGGTDVLEADIVGCQNICANGNDVVNARDGIQEAVSCGGGADRLIADALDIAPTDPGQICESVERDGTGASAAPGGTGTPGTGTQTTTLGGTGTTPRTITKLRIVPGRLGTLLRKGLVVEVPCAATRCAVTVEVRQGKRRLARGTRTLSKGGGKVTARFTTAVRKRLARSKKVTVTVRVRSRLGDATTTTTRRAVMRR